MAPEALARAVAIADAADSAREAAVSLRLELAPMRVVVVDAIDMQDEQPVAVGTKHRIFLGASDGHCWMYSIKPSPKPLTPTTHSTPRR